MNMNFEHKDSIVAFMTRVVSYELIILALTAKSFICEAQCQCGRENLCVGTTWAHYIHTHYIIHYIQLDNQLG